MADPRDPYRYPPAPTAAPPMFVPGGGVAPPAPHAYGQPPSHMPPVPQFGQPPNQVPPGGQWMPPGGAAAPPPEPEPPRHVAPPPSGTLPGPEVGQSDIMQQEGTNFGFSASHGSHYGTDATPHQRRGAPGAAPHYGGGVPVGGPAAPGGGMQAGFPMFGQTPGAGRPGVAPAPVPAPAPAPGPAPGPGPGGFDPYGGQRETQGYGRAAAAAPVGGGGGLTFPEPPGGVVSQNESSGRSTPVPIGRTGGPVNAVPRFLTRRHFNPQPRQPDVSRLFFRVTQAWPGYKMKHAQSPGRMFRSTIQCAPNTPAMLKKFNLPFAVTVHPFIARGTRPTGKEDIPIVSQGLTDVIRCYNCRGFVNPFCEFTDRGYKWRCNLCQVVNDVPKVYFSQLNSSGVRTDLRRRDELTHGAVEFIAPKRYNTKHLFQPVTVVFLIDVSYHAIVSGAVKCACDAIRKSLDDLPSRRNTRVAIMTFHRTLHFYYLEGGNPKMYCVGELEQAMLPCPSGLCVTLSEGREALEKVLDMIPTTLFPMPQTTASGGVAQGGAAGQVNPELEVTENALFSAISSACRVVVRVGGKFQIFLSSLPNAGKTPLPNRAASIPMGEREPLLQAVNRKYQQLAVQLSDKVISVNIFSLFPHNYCDLGTLHVLPRYTAGHLFRYESAHDRAARLAVDVRESLAGIVGYDGVIRVRTSGGLCIRNLHGNFFIKGHDLLSLPYLDNRQSLTVELEHASNYISTKNVSLQLTVLYTNLQGERRIRCLNLMLPITDSLANLYRSADVFAMSEVCAKMALDEVSSSSLATQRSSLFRSMAQSFRTYRVDVRAGDVQAVNELILAGQLRLMPLMVLSFLKHFAMVDEQVVPDMRVAAMATLRAAPSWMFVLLCHPCLMQIDPLPMGVRLPQSDEYDPEMDEDGAAKARQQDEAEWRQVLDSFPVTPLARGNIVGRVYLMNEGTHLSVWLIDQKMPDLEAHVIRTMARELNMSQTEEEDEEEGETDADAEEIEEYRRKYEVLSRLVRSERKKFRMLLPIVVLDLKPVSNQRLLLSRMIEDQAPASDAVHKASYQRFIVILHGLVMKP